MKKLTGQFRNTTWDPLLIICQIVAMQCVFYVGLGLWMLVMNVLVGSSRSLDHLFKYEWICLVVLLLKIAGPQLLQDQSHFLQEIHVRDANGKLVIAAFVLNALLGALGLWFIVQRTKQCLDFTCTAHFFHLLACWYYNAHFPSAFSWWLLNVACITIMCVCGEFLCMRTELQAIPLNLGPKVDL